MEIQNQSTALWSDLFKLSKPQIRAFHMSWFAFFLCFFAWFGITPLMAVVREELQLSRSQVGWSIIASVLATIGARVLFGWLCERIGPRLSYAGLLILGSIPVMLIGFAHDATTFILFRLAIGVLGASFVITQYHSKTMFAPNVVGTANSTSAGWGNLGGGVTQFIMPLVFGLLVSAFGFSESIGWRLSMTAAGLACMLTGVAYLLFTTDAPDGNFRTLRAEGKIPPYKSTSGTFWKACGDYRAWALFVVYGACFGIELTIYNIAGLYFLDYFDYFRGMNAVAALQTAGMIAGLFGLTNLFARTAGGFLGDVFGSRWGLQGRVQLLFMLLFFEGMALMLFSQMQSLTLAVPALLLFSLFVQMSEGATFSVLPFVNRNAVSGVSGIVGCGGIIGAAMAGFLFLGAIPWPTALLILGGIVTLCSFATFVVTFSTQSEQDARRQLAEALARKNRRRDAKQAFPRPKTPAPQGEARELQGV